MTDEPMTMNVNAEMTNVEAYIIRDRYGGMKGLDVVMICDWFLENHRMVTVMPMDKIMYYENGVYHARENGEGWISDALMPIFGHLSKSDGTPALSIKTKKEIYEYLKSRTRVNIYRNMITMEPTFDNNLDLINVRNGLYNWRTKKLWPHDPNYLSIIQLPISYDPKAECKKIKAIVNDVIREKDRTKFLEFIAYSCFRGITMDRIAMILYGPARSGKSEMLRLVRNVLGPSNTASVDMDSLCGGDRFAPAQLYGKLANLVGDINDKPIEDEGTLKKLLSGKDMVTVQNKYEHPFDFINTSKMWLLANVLPRIRDMSSGFYRRAEIIPFDRIFDPNKDDPRRLSALDDPNELAGIFKECMDLLPELLARKRLTNEMDVESIKDVYIKTANPIDGFIMECIDDCVTGSYVTKNDMYESYCEFCKDIRVPATHKVEFGKQFKRAMGWGYGEREGRRTAHGKSQHCWLDVRLGALKKGRGIR